MSDDPIHNETVMATLSRFKLRPEEGAQQCSYQFQSMSDLTGKGQATLTFTGDDGTDVSVQAYVGEESDAVVAGKLRGIDAIVSEPVLEKLVGELVQDHAAGADLCLVGEKGVGKSTVVRMLAARLGYAVEVVHLFNDMSARDLVQRRTTTITGDTVWENTPLVTAALEGRIAVLDGIERLAVGTLNAIQRLLQVNETLTLV